MAKKGGKRGGKSVSRAALRSFHATALINAVLLPLPTYIARGGDLVKR